MKKYKWYRVYTIKQLDIKQMKIMTHKMI